MNGGDFERLISPSQSVWIWRPLQRPREKSVAWEILAAIPQAALETGTSHTHIKLTFAFNMLLFFESLFKEFIYFLLLLLFAPASLRREFDICVRQWAALIPVLCCCCSGRISDTVLKLVFEDLFKLLQRVHILNLEVRAHFESLSHRKTARNLLSCDVFNQPSSHNHANFKRSLIISINFGFCGLCWRGLLLLVNQERE